VHLYARSVPRQTNVMDEIEELKRALGCAAERYNDTQLRVLSRELALAAELLLDIYAHKDRENHQPRSVPPALTESAQAVG
jgi:hypothetical protein